MILMMQLTTMMMTVHSMPLSIPSKRNQTIYKRSLLKLKERRMHLTLTTMIVMLTMTTVTTKMINLTFRTLSRRPKQPTHSNRKINRLRQKPKLQTVHQVAPEPLLNQTHRPRIQARLERDKKSLNKHNNKTNRKLVRHRVKKQLQLENSKNKMDLQERNAEIKTRTKTNKRID